MIVRATWSDLHYEDGSHRWLAPDGVRQEVWEGIVRAHKPRCYGRELTAEFSCRKGNVTVVKRS